MSIQSFSLALFCAALFFMTSAVPAAAEQKVAIVDIQMLLNETSAAKSVQEQLIKKREKLQGEFEAYEKTLRDNEKALVESNNAGDQEAVKTKRAEFETNLLETRRLVQTKKRKLEEAVLQATGKLRSEIVNIVAKIAEEKGYDIVLTRQSVVIVDKAFDISEEVKAALEKSMKKIDLNVED